MTFDFDRIGGWKGIHGWVDRVIELGDRACERYFRPGGLSGADWTRKSDESPVTVADRWIESELRDYASQHFASAAFLGEEAPSPMPESSAQIGEPHLRWVVDPIDGTRAFLRGLPTWSVLVGLECDSLPVLGIAYMPARKELFVGLDGEGARCNDRRLSVSRVDRLREAMVSHGAVSQFSDAACTEMLVYLATATDGQRGFADFDGYRALLLGQVDAMIDPATRPWDLCAPAVLVREAGGAFTDLRGDFTTRSGFGLASNGRIHAELVAALERADAG